MTEKMHETGWAKINLALHVRARRSDGYDLTETLFVFVDHGDTIAAIVAHAKACSETIELGNIEVARDFSDVRAVVDSYARLLDAPQAIGGLFNVCSGEARTLGGVLDMAAELTGHRMEVRVNPAFVRPDEVRMLCGSRARLESVIGEVAMPSLKETVAWMLAE